MFISYNKWEENCFFTYHSKIQAVNYIVDVVFRESELTYFEDKVAIHLKPFSCIW
jgi:hypothetical protein